MNENMKYGLFFLGGLALGAIGAVAVSKGKLDLKPMAADLLSRGMDVKDAVLAKVETVKENMDDMVAEARHAAEQRREAKEEAESSGGPRERVAYVSGRLSLSLERGRSPLGS